MSEQLMMSRPVSVPLLVPEEEEEEEEELAEELRKQQTDCDVQHCLLRE